MTALMPRRRECAVCENPIVVDGRIDRIYCSQSCNNLAWRLRSGKRWGGHLPTLASGTKAGPREGRGALLRRARGARSELLAIRKLAATLTDELAERERDALANKQTIGDLADTVARLRSDRVTEAECAKAELAAERERSQGALEAEQQRSQAALATERERSQAALEAEQQRSQAALAAERERLEQRLHSAMMQSFADRLNLTSERERTAIEAARLQAELAAVQEHGHAALLAEQQRGQTALQAEQERGYERLLSAMTKNFLQDMELKAQDAHLVELQQGTVHLQLQYDGATARLRLLADRRPPETVELRLALDKKNTETERLLSENGKLQRKLVAADQATQLVQKQLSASKEQAQKEKRQHLSAVNQVRLLEIKNNNLAFLYQNREQQLLAQHQGHLAAELRQLQSQSGAAQEYALAEMSRLRIDLATAQSENTQMRAERDRLTVRNTELEAEKSKLFFQTMRFEDRVAALKEKLKLRRAQDQEMLPAESDLDDPGEDQGSSWGSALLGAVAGGAAGLLLGESRQNKTLPAGSPKPTKGLPDGGTR